MRATATTTRRRRPRLPTGISLPASYSENPVDQLQAERSGAVQRCCWPAASVLPTPQGATDYVNFYAYLQGRRPASGHRPRHPRREARRPRPHSHRAYLRPRRDGHGPRRTAAEDLQRLRRDAARAADHQQPGDVPARRDHTTAMASSSTSCRRSRRSLRCPTGPAGPSAAPT